MHILHAGHQTLPTKRCHMHILHAVPQPLPTTPHVPYQTHENSLHRNRCISAARIGRLPRPGLHLLTTNFVCTHIVKMGIFNVQATWQRQLQSSISSCTTNYTCTASKQASKQASKPDAHVQLLGPRNTHSCRCQKRKWKR